MNANGRRDHPLAGWVIVIADGVTLIGLDADGSWLDPVYELRCQMSPVQTDPRRPPQMAIMRSVWPLLTFSGIRRLRVDGGVRIAVEDLTEAEERALSKSVDQCERLLRDMRAADAGVVIARASALPGLR